MKTRFAIYTILVVLVALALILFRRPRQGPADAQQPSEGQAPVAQGKNTTATTAPSAATNITVIESPMHQQLQTPDGFKEYAERKNVPLEFYGRFIDQDSNALAGVDIRVVVRHWTAPLPFQVGSQDIPVERTSDAEGRFELTGATGDVFDIASVNKSGYELEPGGRTFGAIGGTSENPVIFKMWSTNLHEHLISGNKSFKIIPDGRPYIINLADDIINETGPGELKVWVQYTNQVAQGETSDWSAGIEVIGGGLLEQGLGSPMFEAPSDGYVPAFRVQGQVRGGQRGSAGEHQFYLQLKNGHEYGQMSIGLYAPFNNETPGLVRLSYVLNPSGSRILR